MKLILFTICFSIKQRRTRRRGRLRIVVLKIRTLALSLIVRTSDSDSEEVGAVPTEPAIDLNRRLVQRSREHVAYNRKMEYNRVRVPPSPTNSYQHSGREKRFPRLFHRQETFGLTPIRSAIGS